MKNRRVVTGLFRTRAAAENAVDGILKLGYTGQDVSVVMSDETHKRDFTPEVRGTGTNAAEGAGIGGAVGGALGAVLAAIAAVGTAILVPGIGLVVSGPIAAALAGAGAGAAAGGLLGALVGAGIPEDDARVYEQGLRQGGIVLAVEPRSEADDAILARLMEDAGAVSVRHRAGDRVPERV